MFCLKRFVILTLLSLPLFANLAVAGELLPSAEVQGNIAVLTETKNCVNCDLSGANLNRLDLSGANIEGANLSRSTMALTNLSGANLQNTDLREASFTGADLANTDMRGADLTGASFVGAYMVGALMDGEMLSTKPYAKDDISDVEEAVYVEDTVKPKKPPETDELSIGTRRDFEETPPAVPVESIEKKAVQAPVAVTPVKDVPLADEEPIEKMLPSQSAAAPDAKASPAIQEVRLQEDVVVPESLPIIDETKKELNTEVVEEVVVVEKEVVQEDVTVDEAFEKESIVVETEIETVAAVEESEQIVAVSEEVEVTVENTPLEEEPENNVVAADVTVEPALITSAENEATPKDSSQSVAEPETESPESNKEAVEESKGVMDTVLNMFSSAEPSTEVLKNVEILLDSKQCYGCNLQGVNLSGENLDGADLEGADLSNAILKNIDLEEANLKGANLSGADLTDADLAGADLYKANMSGANLTDANLENALLDDVNFTGVTGYNNSSILLLDAN